MSRKQAPAETGLRFVRRITPDGSLHHILQTRVGADQWEDVPLVDEETTDGPSTGDTVGDEGAGTGTED